MVETFADDPVTRDTLRRLALATHRELIEGILPVWLSREDPAGGHWISIDAEGRIDRTAPRRLIFAARLAWTFTTAARRLAHPRLEAAADHAHAFLERFRDTAVGGFHTALDASGAPLDRSRRVYGQAFALFALSAHALAHPGADATAAALAQFDLLVSRARDPDTGLYVETLSPDWIPQRDGTRTSNTHLHLIEALVELHTATRLPRVATALRDLIATFARYFVDPDGRAGRAEVDSAGHPLPGLIWPGHDIEVSHLLSRAADLLDGGDGEPDLRRLAHDLACGATAAGMRPDGGWSLNGGDGEGASRRVWWVQAEALLGLLDDGLRSGSAATIAHAGATWDFIERHQRDRTFGDWHMHVDVGHRGRPDCPRVTEWKEPYHQFRACLEVFDRCVAALGSIAPDRLARLDPARIPKAEDPPPPKRGLHRLLSRLMPAGNRSTRPQR